MAKRPRPANISIDCERPDDCTLGVEACEACRANALEQEIDQAQDDWKDDIYSDEDDEDDE